MNQEIPESAQRRVGDIMTKQVIKVHPDTSVHQIAKLMAEHNISGLPVVDEHDRVLGIVTELDVIVRNTRFKLPNFVMILDMIIYLETPGHFRERLEHMLGATAQDIMSKPAISTTPEATIEDLASLMVGRRMNPIPVVENKRLVGIVSRSDIIHLMAQEVDSQTG